MYDDITVTYCSPHFADLFQVKDRMEEGDRVLSALHDLPIEDEHVQYQKREILEVISIEASQKPFNLVTLIWDNTELQAGRRLRISLLILAFQQLMGMLTLKNVNSTQPLTGCKGLTCWYTIRQLYFPRLACQLSYLRCWLQ
jgi:hypothetical protein